MAGSIARRAGQSLPQQCEDWGELKAAYRLLSNGRIEPTELSRPHRELTYSACAGQPVVLAVQDDTHLAGRCNRECHSTLAVLPEGRLIGLLDQHFFQRVELSDEESRSARQARWRESLVWSQAVESIGLPPPDCRLIHVADRAADNLEFIEACQRTEVGFVVRARHDRRVEEGTGKLWAFLAARAVQTTCLAEVGEQRDTRGRIVRRGRQAQLAVRWAKVQLDAPAHCARQRKPLPLYALYLEEESPPADVEPVQWMLLTGEHVQCAEDALRVIAYYQRRWVIEEWHRALKEGCALEASQLDEPEDHERLASILSIVAVRLLQLRDLASPAHPEADQSEALRRWAPPMWIRVVAQTAQIPAHELTPRLFLLTIAKRGGYLGRKNDPRPGWKVLWRGWYDFSLLVQGTELALQQTPP